MSPVLFYQHLKKCCICYGSCPLQRTVNPSALFRREVATWSVTINSHQTCQRHWLVWTRTIRSRVTPTGGTLQAISALAIRERSLSGSGWRVTVTILDLSNYNYRRGTSEQFCRISTAVVQRFCKPKVGSSNLSSGTRLWSQSVHGRTSACHAERRGSLPLGTAKL
jgi:hypothetical protein